MRWKNTLATAPWAAIAYPLLYLIAPNLPLWLFARKLWLLPHGYFNVECLFVGSAAVFLPGSLVFCLLAFEMLCSFIYLVCYTYQFSLGSLLASLHYLSLLPTGRLTFALPALALILVLSALLAFGVPRPNGQVRLLAVAALLASAVFLIAFDTFDGRNPVWRNDSSGPFPRLTMSPIVTLSGRAILLHSVEASARIADDREMPSASAKGIGFLDIPSSRQSPNVILILVESWGLLREPDLAGAIESGYNNPSIQNAYRLTFGTVPFDGLTVPGEARELCHSRLGFGILNLSKAERSRCLPDVLHNHGYQNIAVHGYMGAMFERDEWYRAIGFDQLWFKRQLSRANLPACNGAFPGICDGSIARWIGRSLLSGNSNQPKFIYWVTLNSHLPVPQHPDLSEDNTCTLHPELARSNALCSWFRLVLAVHRSVQNLALALIDRPTVLILVGDHAPPFADPQLRAMFSSAYVPYTILTPRSLSQ